MVSCPHSKDGFCSREDCNFILNGGCAWMAERSVVTTDDNTGFVHCHGCLWAECFRRGLCLRNSTDSRAREKS
jgi:hypothetical protein